MKKLSVMLMLFAGGCNTPTGEAMRDMKFEELYPPQSGYDVGMLVASQQNFLGSVETIDPICIAGQLDPISTAPVLARVQNDQTAEVERLKKLSADGKLVIDAPILKKINTDLNATSSGKKIRQINLDIKNASIKWLLRSDADALSSAYSKLPYCETSLKKAEGRGLKGNIIERVFIADVVYSVDTETGIDLGMDLEVQAALKANLNADFDNTTHTFSTGKHLVYGYKLL